MATRFENATKLSFHQNSYVCRGWVVSVYLELHDLTDQAEICYRRLMFTKQEFAVLFEPKGLDFRQWRREKFLLLNCCLWICGKTEDWSENSIKNILGWEITKKKGKKRGWKLAQSCQYGLKVCHNHKNKRITNKLWFIFEELRPCIGINTSREWFHLRTTFLYKSSKIRRNKIPIFMVK